MCDLSRSQLMAWVDDELDGHEASVVAEHVEGCSACRSEVIRIRSMSRDIAEYTHAAAGLTPRRNWRWVAVAAAAAVLLAAGLMWMRPRPVEPAPVVARKVDAPAVRIPARVEVVAAPKPRPVRRAVRAVTPRTPERDSPGVLVAIPIDQMLPVGAAPPGALLVGRMSFDVRGLPASFQVE